MGGSRMRFPLASNVIRGNSVSNTFGMVRHYPDGTPKAHQGHDYAASPGTPIFAIADGTIADVRDHGDYGVQLLLDIGGGRWAFYAHLTTVSVSVGQAVAEGEALGTTGKTGNAANLRASEDHLHFEARTTPHPGLGLAGRVSPADWFGSCPLHVAVVV